MVFIPFIYFTILSAFFIYRHKRIDLCVLMSLFYTATSLGAIFIVKCHLLGDAGILFQDKNLDLGFTPTLMYCLLITIAILPFDKVRGINIKSITNEYKFLFYSLCIALLLLSLFIDYLIADSSIDIINKGFWQVRTSFYNGQESPVSLKLKSMPIIFGYLFYLNKCTLLLLPCFFYSICFEKNKWWFNTILFLGSISVPLTSIQNADRSDVFLYVIMFLICGILFYKYFTKKHWRFIMFISIPILIAFGVYFLSATKARFQTKKNGELISIVRYAGQPYLNFCYIYKYSDSNFTYTDRIMPLYNHFILKNDLNPYQNSIEKSTEIGFKAGVFSSLIGAIMLDIGKVGVIIWVILFCLLCFILLPRGSDTVVSFWQYNVVFTLAVIPLFGIISYRYNNYMMAFIPVITIGLFVVTELYKKFISIKQKDKK